MRRASAIEHRVNNWYAITPPATRALSWNPFETKYSLRLSITWPFQLDNY